MFSNTSFHYYLLPFLIFLSRIADVTLGTIQIIFVAKGMKYLAPLVGFYRSVNMVSGNGNRDGENYNQ
ncbi:MAG: hypothetical protein SVM86_01090 [Candidatus Cloacimonadota bacterium]|nr:hypothetical protein [Candidatus Cloacimonadota bacterium]